MTQEAKPTLGAFPWVLKGLYVYDGAGWYVAQVNLDNEDPRAIAIANLIAAAPDLLAALRDLEIGANTVAACYTRNPGNFAAALRDLGDYADKARAAIARATPAHQ